MKWRVTVLLVLAVLAVASAPRFDPNVFSGEDSARITELLKDPDRSFIFCGHSGLHLVKPKFIKADQDQIFCHFWMFFTDTRWAVAISDKVSPRRTT